MQAESRNPTTAAIADGCSFWGRECAARYLGGALSASRCVTDPAGVRVLTEPTMSSSRAPGGSMRKCDASIAARMSASTAATYGTACLAKRRGQQAATTPAPLSGERPRVFGGSHPPASLSAARTDGSSTPRRLADRSDRRGSESSPFRAGDGAAAPPNSGCSRRSRPA
jgi:hypothetical protein